jgi:FkbM family methyltransferase
MTDGHIFRDVRETKSNLKRYLTMEEATGRSIERTDRSDENSSAGGGGWQDKLRDRIIRFGIRMVCGVSPDVEGIEPSVAADIPLVSAGLRFSWLRILERLGVTTTMATSAFGHRFVCHIGDYAEFPYYHRRALAPELALCAAWLRDANSPVIFDVGANVGFFATQLSQMLAERKSKIYAFEPVPSTFAKLVSTVRKLELYHSVHPIAAAALDRMTIVDITCANGNSLLSQVGRQDSKIRLSGFTAHVPSICLDAFSAKFAAAPTLIKLDVEGSEAAALRGARNIIASDAPPAIALEFSPRMLAECGESVDSLDKLLSGYTFHYVDDIVGQKRRYGSIVDSLHELEWTCNLFAVPSTDRCAARCAEAFEHARRTLDMHR